MQSAVHGIEHAVTMIAARLVMLTPVHQFASDAARARCTTQAHQARMARPVGAIDG